MKGKRYTEEQTIGVLKEHEAGMPAQNAKLKQNQPDKMIIVSLEAATLEGEGQWHGTRPLLTVASTESTAVELGLNIYI